MLDSWRAFRSEAGASRGVWPTEGAHSNGSARFRVLFRPLGVAPSPSPRLEDTIRLSDGRRLGYAEFGDPAGPLVLWFHGSPGARRQVPVAGRDAAEHLGLRLVCVERPGVGNSTDHAYHQ